MENQSENTTPKRICENCGAEIIGKYCHACGQKGRREDRNIFHLSWDITKELFSFDSKLFLTIPNLFFRPARLTQDYLGGRIARHVPPFRLFIFSLLVLVLSLQFKIDNYINTDPIKAAANQTQKDKDHFNFNFNINNKNKNLEKLKVNASDTNLPDLLREGNPKLAQQIKESGTDEWAKKGLVSLFQSPRLFIQSSFEWAQRLAILLLPITTLFLGLFFIGRRKIFLYDHGLVAMGLMSFVFFYISICLLLPSSIGWWLYLASFVLVPLNFFFVFKNGYQTSTGGAIFRSLGVSLGVFITFSLVILGVIFLALFA